MWRRFWRHKLALLALFILSILVLVVILAPFIAPFPPNAIDLRSRNMPPSTLHWLGTDGLGRDVLSRVLYGGRISLSVSGAAAAVACTIGLFLGLVAGFAGGKIDLVIMRLADMVLCLPSLVLSMALLTLVGPTLRNVIIAISFPRWPSVARLVRGQVLALKEREFVTAARAIGAPTRHILIKHLVPHVLSVVMVAATLQMASAIILEASLSFLGIGLPLPNPSWGNMLQGARTITTLESAPWQWVPPGAAIVLSVLCVNFIGDGLRDALDPRLTRRL